MILKLDDNQYIHWDEANKCPKTSILNKEEMDLYIRGYLLEAHNWAEIEASEQAIIHLIILLKVRNIWEKINKNNSTCSQGRCLEEIIKENLAGQEKESLSIKEIIEHYTYNPDNTKFPF